MASVESPRTIGPVGSDVAIFDLWMSLYPLKLTKFFVKKGIFDTLSTIALTAEALATHHGMNADMMTRALMILEQMKFTQQVENPLGPDHPRQWQLTTQATHFLVSSSPTCWSAMLLDEFGLNKTSLELLMVTGQPQWKVVDNWDRVSTEGLLNASRALVVMRGMHAHSVVPAKLLPWHQILPLKKKIEEKTSLLICDVAAGSGVFSIELTRQHPTAKCILLELGEAAQLVRTHFLDPPALTPEHSSRISVFQGDMFNPNQWPYMSFDAVFMSEVAHDWTDDQCVQLFAIALIHAPVLILNEILLPTDPSLAPSVTPFAYSLHMGFCTRGRQRTLTHFTQLLTQAGFSSVSCISHYGDTHWSLIIAQCDSGKY